MKLKKKLKEQGWKIYKLESGWSASKIFNGKEVIIEIDPISIWITPMVPNNDKSKRIG